MYDEQVIQKTKMFVRERLGGEPTGHDWWHVYRVWRMSKRIAEEESKRGKTVNIFVVELAALLHDIADYKFNNGDEEVGLKITREWLSSLKVPEEIIVQVCEIIKQVSFKGAGVETKPSSIEGEIVQDADRLDALGAIGIARCFATGSRLGNPIYIPGLKPVHHNSFEEYKTKRTTSINHFYEKLLLLKDRMNTETGRRLAEGRHKYMEEYLERFFKEWEGEL